MASPGGFQTVTFSPADQLAVTAAYDLFFGCAAGLPAHREQLRAQLIELTPGRAAVGALVTLGGVVSFLYRDDLGQAAVFADIVQSALQATQYPELRV